MSVDDAQEFLRQLTSDPDLAREDAVARRRKLVQLARTKGFHITEEDLAEAARQAQMAYYGPVDDAALECVVGGVEGYGADINFTFN